jgi:hypothetical protein
LSEFITMHRNDIVGRTRARVRGRPWPSVSDGEVEHGVPLCLTQVSETLRLEATGEPFPSDAIESSATRYGAELLTAGLQRGAGRPRLRRHPAPIDSPLTHSPGLRHSYR